MATYEVDTDVIQLKINEVTEILNEVGNSKNMFEMYSTQFQPDYMQNWVNKTYQLPELQQEAESLEIKIKEYLEWMADTLEAVVNGDLQRADQYKDGENLSADGTGAGGATNGSSGAGGGVSGGGGSNSGGSGYQAVGQIESPGLSYTPYSAGSGTGSSSGSSYSYSPYSYSGGSGGTGSGYNYSYSPYSGINGTVGRGSGYNYTYSPYSGTSGTGSGSSGGGYSYTPGSYGDLTANYTYTPGSYSPYDYSSGSGGSGSGSDLGDSLLGSAYGSGSGGSGSSNYGSGSSGLGTSAGNSGLSSLDGKNASLLGLAGGAGLSLGSGIGKNSQVKPEATSLGKKAGISSSALAGTGIALGLAGIGAGFLLGSRSKYYTFDSEDWLSLTEDDRYNLINEFVEVDMTEAEIEIFTGSTYKIKASELDEPAEKIEKIYDENPGIAQDIMSNYMIAAIDESGKVDRYILFIIMIIDGKKHDGQTNLYSIINNYSTDDIDFIYSGINMEDYIEEIEDDPDEGTEDNSIPEEMYV